MTKRRHNVFNKNILSIGTPYVSTKFENLSNLKTCTFQITSIFAKFQFTCCAENSFDDLTI